MLTSGHVHILIKGKRSDSSLELRGTQVKSSPPKHEMETVCRELTSD